MVERGAWVRALLAACVLAPFSIGDASAQAPGDTVLPLDTLRVEVGRLRAGGLPLGRLPFSADVIRGSALRQPGLTTLAGALAGAVGVSMADQFGSPAQPDLRLRGFQVGPVVGYPQSISVFVDGVRVNEPDGSQVNFDLIPLQAIERIEVIRAPGGAFGRNTLAGAINVVTRSAPEEGGLDAAVEVGVGSFGSAGAQGWAGGRWSGVDYLMSGRYHRASGWRELNETVLRQAFAKIGRRSDEGDVWLSYTFADNRVEGPGSLPLSWLRGELPADLRGAEDPRRLQFTGFQGDVFEPRLHFLAAGGSRLLPGGHSLQVNGFFRANDLTQLNDNITEPNARGDTDIRSVGATAQLSLGTAPGMVASLGLEYVRNRVGIRIFELPNPAFPDVDAALTEHVRTVEDNAGAFGQLWWPFSPRAALTASLRYDWVRLPVRDLLDPEKSGDNTFHQLTGSIGADYLITEKIRAYGSFGRGFRAPVILEISCADPEDPCPLPFELGADPPLDPVTADTWQVGGRLLGPRSSSVELTAYWTEVHDDLFNVVALPSTRGYFKNLDRTRRQGLELAAVSRPLGDLRLRGTVALTRATFQTTAMLASALLTEDDDGDREGPNAPPAAANPDGAVVVEPGDRFAMMPGFSAGWEVGYAPGGWALVLDGSYTGEQHFVGDEDNGGELGTLEPYFLLGGEIKRAVGEFVASVRIENLLDNDHYTFGLISPNVRGPRTEAQPFLTPGLPRSVVVSLRWSGP